MTDKELILDTLRQSGRLIAADLQRRSAEMTGAQLYDEADYIPAFSAAVKQNMLTRLAGFVCRSPAGRVVRLLQPYDSSIYPQDPEDLPAQWGFLWSNDPAHARPFVAISTSPYMAGDCCTDEGKVWRSVLDNNIWRPADYPAGWKEVADGS